MTDTLRLCYIDGPWAFFTTQPLDQQWGDDWNDAPYEHNAGDPYEPCWHNQPHGLRQVRQNGKVGIGEVCRCSICVDEWNDDGTPKWRIEKVAWECVNLDPPCERVRNSPWSVEDINGGATTWLEGDTDVRIYAGTTIAEFCELVRAAGGDVYLKLDCLDKLRGE